MISRKHLGIALCASDPHEKAKDLWTLDSATRTKSNCKRCNGKAWLTNDQVLSSGADVRDFTEQNVLIVIAWWWEWPFLSSIDVPNLRTKNASNVLQGRSSVSGDSISRPWENVIWRFCAAIWTFETQTRAYCRKSVHSSGKVKLCEEQTAEQLSLVRHAHISHPLKNLRSVLLYVQECWQIHWRHNGAGRDNHVSFPHLSGNCRVDGPVHYKSLILLQFLHNSLNSWTHKQLFRVWVNLKNCSKFPCLHRFNLGSRTPILPRENVAALRQGTRYIKQICPFVVWMNKFKSPSRFLNLSHSNKSSKFGALLAQKHLSACNELSQLCVWNSLRFLSSQDLFVLELNCLPLGKHSTDKLHRSWCLHEISFATEKVVQTKGSEPKKQKVRLEAKLSLGWSCPQKPVKQGGWASVQGQTYQENISHENIKSHFIEICVPSKTDRSRSEFWGTQKTMWRLAKGPKKSSLVFKRRNNAFVSPVN